MTYQDYVCGTRFKDLANAIYQDNGAVKVDSFKRGNKIPVFYCHTHQFKECIGKIKTFANETILLTHNSDGSVRNGQQGQQIREHDADASLLPENVVKWYAQNVEVDLNRHKNIVPIPIGLENRYCFDYDKAEMLFNKQQRLPSKDYYFNCNLYTNQSERRPALERCQQLQNSTVKLNSNGHDYNQFLEDILDHSAVVSPSGNGLDCHRTYEALYLRRVPIMKFTASLATMKLPILWLEDWSELQQTPKNGFLLSMLKNIVTNTNPPALSMKYWKERINNAE